MYSKIAFIVAATAVLAKAQSASQLAELNAIVDDVKSHLSDYMGLISSGAISISDLPAGVMPVVLAVQTATDDSYTSLYKDVDVAALGPFLSKLPWYSSRLAPELENADVKEATTSAAAPVASSSAAAPVASSSAAAPIASSSSAAPVASSSSAAPVASSSVAEVSSSVATSAAPSSTAAVSQQTENSAGKLSDVMGLAAVGAVAMLL